MTTLPLADVRARLSELVSEAEQTHQRVEITRNGRAAAVLLSADDFEAMQDTIDVLADPDLVRDLREGLADVAAGRTIVADDLAEQMRRAGRL